MSSSPAADDVGDAIRTAGRPIPFQRVMDIALYGEHGFYSSGGRAGRRRGDFLTSPEVGPLFGAVLARAIGRWWRELGSPGEFVVIDAGAGPGTLSRALLAAAPTGVSRYITVEPAAAQRAEHPAGVEALADLPERVECGIVIANELLDNLPFRLAVFDGAWREAFVDVDRHGVLGEVLSAPIDPLPEWLPARASHGARVPIQSAATEWVTRACRTLGSGRVVAFDYAEARTAVLANRPWREWLRTYVSHGRGAHYLADLGRQDITADVCLDQYPSPDAVRTQAQFLQLHGIGDLVDEGRREWTAAAALPTVRALTMRSRLRESEALLDPGGLGGFSVMEWRVA